MLSASWVNKALGCDGNRHVPKKVSAATFSPDSRFAFIADKYGDVYTVRVPRTLGDHSREPCVSPSTEAGQAGPPGLSNAHAQQGNASDGQGSSTVEETKGTNTNGEPGQASGGDGTLIGSEEGKYGMELLLGHFCSIVTSLDVSRDGRYIASTDRDNKVRINIVPADPMQASSPPPPRGAGGAPIDMRSDVGASWLAMLSEQT